MIKLFTYIYRNSDIGKKVLFCKCRVNILIVERITIHIYAVKIIRKCRTIIERLTRTFYSYTPCPITILHFVAHCQFGSPPQTMLYWQVGLTYVIALATTYGDT